MKRTLLIALLALTSLSVAAEQKLKILELDDAPVSEEYAEKGRAFSAAQDKASKVPAPEAKDFITKLNHSVTVAMSQLQNKQMDKTKARDQIIELRKFEKDGKRFGVMTTPFHKCNEAAINAATSWEGLINNNLDQFQHGYMEYLQAGAKCEEAAN